MRCRYVDVILQLVEKAGDFVSDDIWYRVVQIVTNNDDLQAYAASKGLAYLRASAVHETMIKVRAARPSCRARSACALRPHGPAFFSRRPLSCASLPHPLPCLKLVWLCVCVRGCRWARTCWASTATCSRASPAAAPPTSSPRCTTTSTPPGQPAARRPASCSRLPGSRRGPLVCLPARACPLPL